MSGSVNTDLDTLFTFLYVPLDDDATKALKSAREDSTDYANRVAFRVVLSAIEGLISLLKQHVLKVDPHLTEAERVLLLEKTYILDECGNPKDKPNFLKVSDNLLFAWKMCFRRTEPTFSPDQKCDGWRFFKESVRVRNRITHPKKPSDLHVSQGELRDLQTAYEWIKGTTFKSSTVLSNITLSMFQRLDSNLSPNVLDWLERFVLAKFVEPTLSSDGRLLWPANEQIDEDILSMLLKQGLAQKVGDEVFINKLCSVYLQWRHMDSAEEEME